MDIMSNCIVTKPITLVLYLIVRVYNTQFKGNQTILDMLPR